MSVEGDFTLLPAADVTFEGCHHKKSNQTKGHGGGLKVGRDLSLHGGRLHFNSCHSDGHGGGVHVEGKRSWSRVLLVISFKRWFILSGKLCRWQERARTLTFSVLGLGSIAEMPSASVPIQSAEVNCLKWTR